MVDKKVVAIATIIAVIVFGLVLGLRIKNLNKYEYKEPTETGVAQSVSNNKAQESKTAHSSTENISTNNTSENEASENELEENKAIENSNAENEKENSNSENKAENTTSNTSSENTTTENNSAKNTNTSTSKNNSTSKIDSTEKDPEKLAISLAKEKWGKKNSNVYFDVEDKNEKKGIYTIVVRDSSTTIEMVTYKVDVNKKTVTE